MTLDEAIKYYEKASEHMEQFFGSANSTVECQQLVEWLKQVPRWISVEDELPEKYKEVLVHTAKYGVQVDWIADTPYYWHNYGELVTHWQPKPEPLKGE